MQIQKVFPRTGQEGKPSVFVPDHIRRRKHNYSRGCCQKRSHHGLLRTRGGTAYAAATGSRFWEEYQRTTLPEYEIKSGGFKDPAVQGESDGNADVTGRQVLS